VSFYEIEVGVVLNQAVLVNGFWNEFLYLNMENLLL